MERLPRTGVGGLTHDAERSPSSGTSRGAAPPFDAIVLAGGRAARLGGYPKPQLTYRGATLLEHALGAVADAHRAVVVGPAPEGRPSPLTRVPREVLYTLEEPRFGGPLAALGAGLAALGTGGAAPQSAVPPRAAAPPAEAPAWVAVLAADLPRAAEALTALLRAAGDDPAADGVLGEDGEGRAQPLLAVYRRGPLVSALRDLADAGGLADRPLKHLIARLDLLPLRLPPEASSDVDTWEAARHWGIERPDAPGGPAPQEEAHE